MRCLSTVRAAAPEAELVVVDDASADGTADAVRKRFPQARVLVNPTRSGFTASVNRGATITEGDFLLILNSDTEVSRPSLEALRRAFEGDAGLGIVGAQLLYPDGRRQWSSGPVPGLLWFFLLGSGAGKLLGGVRRLRRLLRRRRPRPVLSAGWVTGAALAIRRELWRELGGFEESYGFYAQDLDLCTRCRRAGYKVGLASGFQVLHHHGATIARVRPKRQLAHGQPDLLWTDLMKWAERHRGEAWARRARRVLTGAVRLRLVLRAFGALVLQRERREAWRRQDLVLRRALRALAGRSRGPANITPREAGNQ